MKRIFYLCRLFMELVQRAGVTAVRETGISRHHVAQLSAPLNSRESRQCVTEGFKGGPQLGPY